MIISKTTPVLLNAGQWSKVNRSSFLPLSTKYLILLAATVIRYYYHKVMHNLINDKAVVIKQLH
jgi:hypothetical protein